VQDGRHHERGFPPQWPDTDNDVQTFTHENYPDYVFKPEQHLPRNWKAAPWTTWKAQAGPEWWARRNTINYPKMGPLAERHSNVGYVSVTHKDGTPVEDTIQRTFNARYLADEDDDYDDSVADVQIPEHPSLLRPERPSAHLMERYGKQHRKGCTRQHPQNCTHRVRESEA
jgi:hypothetical protein